MIRVGFDISLVEVRYRHYTKQIKPSCAAFDEGSLDIADVWMKTLH